MADKEAPKEAPWKDAKLVGVDEDLPVQVRHDVYPFIDPTVAFGQKTYKGQVALIVGASKGIGQEIARFYARAGASLTIVARAQAALDETRALILSETTGAQVLAVSADVKDYTTVAKAVEATVTQYGKLDILIVNAGTLTSMYTLSGDMDPNDWWNTLEVNVRGVFNFFHAALVHLKGGHGRVVVTTSSAAQLRIPGVADYGTSKHAVGRLVEYIALEYPDIKVFNVHPGSVPTTLADKAGIDQKLRDVAMPDSPRLAAATMLYLTAGKADWLSGRYISSTWDLEEVERDWKEKIIAKGGLVSKLLIP